MRLVTSAALALSLAIPLSTVVAGVVDTPLPELNGRKGKHVFSIPGVVSATGGMETAFLCTSLEKAKTIRIAVQVFDVTGALQGTAQQDLAPGATATLVTADTPFVDGDQITAGIVVAQGSARVVATSTKLMCSALVVEKEGSVPPTSMAGLQVIRKVSQKGD